jgi:hypothetical protein
MATATIGKPWKSGPANPSKHGGSKIIRRYQMSDKIAVVLGRPSSSVYHAHARTSIRYIPNPQSFSRNTLAKWRLTIGASGKGWCGGMCGCPGGIREVW